MQCVATSWSYCNGRANRRGKVRRGFLSIDFIHGFFTFSTYNYLSNVDQRMLRAYEKGDMKTAQMEQVLRISTRTSSLVHFTIVAKGSASHQYYSKTQ